jgi:hypothetical protein
MSEPSDSGPRLKALVGAGLPPPVVDRLAADPQVSSDVGDLATGLDPGRGPCAGIQADSPVSPTCAPCDTGIQYRNSVKPGEDQSLQQSRAVQGRSLGTGRPTCLSRSAGPRRPGTSNPPEMTNPRAKPQVGSVPFWYVSRGALLMGHSLLQGGESSVRDRRLGTCDRRSR